MAKYRTVSVKFWSDPWIQSLTPEQKYFFLYLITNPQTTQCGIYEVTVRQMVFETGYNSETIEKLLDLFVAQGKVIYNKTTLEMAILNWPTYNFLDSPTVIAFIRKELLKVRDRTLVTKMYSKYDFFVKVGIQDNFPSELNNREKEVNVPNQADFPSHTVSLRNREETEKKNKQEEELRAFDFRRAAMERRKELLPVSKAVAAFFGKKYPEHPEDTNPAEATFFTDVFNEAEKIQRVFGLESVKQIQAYKTYCANNKRKTIGRVFRLADTMIESDWLVLTGQKQEPTEKPILTSAMKMAEQEIKGDILPEYFVKQFANDLNDPNFRAYCKEYLAKHNL